MFFSNSYHRLMRLLGVSEPVTTGSGSRTLTKLDHTKVHTAAHGREVDDHVLRNGDLDLNGYLASIGLTGQFEVWAEVVDVNGDTGAETDAYLDAMTDALADALERGEDYVDMPIPNDPLSMANGGYLDDLGRVTIYTIVDHTTQTIIGDAIHAHDEYRWIFEYHPGYMGAVCN